MMSTGFVACECEDIRGDPTDTACGWACFRGDGDGVRIQIAPCQVDGDVCARGPLLDAPQSVAVAAGNVEDMRGSLLVCEFKRVEPVEDGPVGEEPAIDASEIVKTGAHDFARAWLVHQFGRARRVG